MQTQPAPTTTTAVVPLARRSQATRESLAAAVVALGALAVVALWWQDTSNGALHSLGDELTAVGRLTGLLGTYLLLVEVLLLARVPVLDRLVGMDRLVTWHRRNGEYVVSLLSVHAVAIVLGYALADHHAIVSETTDVVLHEPDVLAATAALGLLVAVGVLSARAVRRRVAYQTWYFVHLYVYLAAVLAFAHQLATGDEFATHPWHRAFWVVLHVATLALLLTYRVVVPVRGALRHRLRVEEIRREAPGVISMTITGDRLDELGADAGQFFLWRFLTRDGWWQAHPFSLSAVPTDRSMRITVQQVGDHTRALAHVHAGVRVLAEGPYGAVTLQRRSRRKVLFVAGGIGVAPLRAMFEAAPARPGDVTFLYRASTEDELVHRAELEDLARRRGDRIAYLLGSRRAAAELLSPAVLARELPDLADHDAYVCGSPSFVDWAVDALHRAGLSRRHIHAERFEL